MLYCLLEAELFSSSFELVANYLNKSKFLFNWPNSFPIDYNSPKNFKMQELLGTEERTVGTYLENVFAWRGRNYEKGKT